MYQGGYPVLNQLISIDPTCAPCLSSHLARTPEKMKQLPNSLNKLSIDIITHRIHGAAIYGAPWIPSIYPSHVSIFLPAPWIRHESWITMLQ